MSQNKRYFVTGIDTDAGKSIVSAILVQKLKADYWKPVQAGEPTDSNFVRSMIDSDLVIHPEGVILEHPMSPHAAAERENVKVERKQFSVPETENNLIIEGAGGLMVPINSSEFVIDFARDFDAEVILVSRNYLGSINHTMLSIEYLKSNDFKIKGLIFNDEPNPETESFILQYSGIPCLGHIPKLKEISAEEIAKQADNIQI
ncbi:dethiobiotin synthase [Reichenbachiella ulvae]|uniref:ATP-dependent dethiobiotin synthetase BioD n=1 Tax=Reichenbachiella ulvae TaxID=2980104 RepID=A0ABT3CR27_9BACT|nr:dethiobiotin synthase [Reichenbachiella ulvae]MCV9385723.1 dethiobiotin synthase [Reichenbachiella ulvae]